MKRTMFLVLIATAALALALAPARRAAADDETDDVQIKLRAPLDAVSCDPTAPTITVLGLTIDISGVSFSGDQGGGDTQGGGASDGSGDGEDDNGGQNSGGCAALTQGQTVEVKLTSDIPPLMATELDVSGDGEAEVKGPVQTADATNQTITILGLTIDVSKANASGADDDSEDGNSQPIDLSQVTSGQTAEVKLDAGQLPALVATEFHVMNFSNQVEVEVDDSTGQEVDDVDETTGTPEDDVDVTATVTTMVKNTTGTRSRRVRKVVRLHHVTNGSFKLTGLPTGQAAITVTRNRSGVVAKARRSVRVRGNATRSLRLRLRSR